MRLPVLPPAPPPPSEDLYEIQERPPVTPARYIQARNLPPLIVPPRRPPRRAAGRAAPDEGQQSPPVYQGEERRKADRRVAQQSILLDTRVRRDRRRPRVGGEGEAGVDIEA